MVLRFRFTDEFQANFSNLSNEVAALAVFRVQWFVDVRSEVIFSNKFLVNFTKKSNKYVQLKVRGVLVVY